MASIKIFDATAMLTFLEDEIGADIIRGYLSKTEDGSVKIFMSYFDLGEIWQVVSKVENEEIADNVIKNIEGMNIEFISLDWLMIRQAAIFKNKSTLPIMCCYSASLAKYKKGELITKERKILDLKEYIRIQII